jgi:hypothetical protein
MLAVTYGLQVSSLFFCFLCCCINQPYNCRPGDHLYHQERIHARRLDGCLSYFVRRFFLGSSVFERIPSLTVRSIFRYPVYSFFLPIYSFWCMDEFGWGNTRLVIGEGKDKKVIVNDDEKFDDSMIPLKKFSGTLPKNVQIHVYISL